MPLRLLPVLFFASFALLFVLTEHVGQRLHGTSDYDPQVLSRSLYLMAIGVGFARRGVWFWWFCLLAWPIQLFAVAAVAATMPEGVDLGPDADLVVYSSTEATLILVQVAVLAAMLVCLLLPATRAALSKDAPSRLFDDAVLGVFMLLGVAFVGLRAAEAERAITLGAAIAAGVAAETTDASAALMSNGAMVTLAAPLAVACNVPGHAFARKAATGQASLLRDAAAAPIAVNAVPGRMAAQEHHFGPG